jgi:pSer/pThr/pTyr-binding forkhead associated (FHA) protein
VSEKSYQLVMQEGPKPGQVFDLIGGALTLGRDELADIVIVDPEVSRQHLQLMETDTGYRLQDLGSTNGTFVNGRRLSAEPVDLEPGQEIMLGSSIVLLYQETGEAFVLPTLPEEAEEEDAFPFVRPVVPDEEPESPAISGMEQAELDEAAGEEAERTLLDIAAEDIEAIFEETADSEADVDTDVEPEAPSPVVTPSSSLPAAQANEAKRSGPLVPPGKGQHRRGRNRVLLITILLLLLCCCVLTLFMWFIGGDFLLQYWGLI